MLLKPAAINTLIRGRIRPLALCGLSHQKLHSPDVAVSVVETQISLLNLDLQKGPAAMSAQFVHSCDWCIITYDVMTF